MPADWQYPGDALWALTVFFAWRTPSAAPRMRATALRALAASAAVEFAKPWQAPWLARWRHTTFGP